MTIVDLTTGQTVQHIVFIKLIEWTKYSKKINGEVGLVLFIVENDSVFKTISMMDIVALIMVLLVLNAGIFCTQHQQHIERMHAVNVLFYKYKITNTQMTMCKLDICIFLYICLALMPFL